MSRPSSLNRSLLRRKAMLVIETCPKCGADLASLAICTYPPIPAKRCTKCDFYWEGEQEKIVRIPFEAEAVCIRDQQAFTDEELKTYWKAIDKNSKSTGTNVFDIMK